MDPLIAHNMKATKGLELDSKPFVADQPIFYQKLKSGGCGIVFDFLCGICYTENINLQIGAYKRCVKGRE